METFAMAGRSNWFTRGMGLRGRDLGLFVGVLSLLAFAAVGCGGGYESAWDEPVDDSSGGEVSEQDSDRRATLIAEGDAAWLERDDPDRIRAAITAWEGAVEIDGSDHESWVKISRAYYFLSDGHLRFSAPDEMQANYQAGILAAERALRAISPEFAQAMAAGAEHAESVQLLQANAIPALYWRATNLGKWARADGFATLLARKDEIRAHMSRCLELGRDFFFTGPDRYFGAYYAIAPTYAGGDLARSQQHFEYSISQQPNYFGTRVLMAENLAVKLQNRQMFEEQLRYVIDGDPTALAGAEPENRVEQREAADLLERIDEFFLE